MAKQWRPGGFPVKREPTREYAIDGGVVSKGSTHVIASMGLGGAESFYERLTQALRERGNPVARVVRSGSRLAEKCAKDNDCTDIPMHSYWDLRGAYAIRRHLKDAQPAVIQTWMSRATWLTRVPRGSQTIHLARLGNYYKLKYYRHADYWVANGKGICDFLIEGGQPADRVFHIANFVERSELPGLSDRVALRRELNLPDDALAVFSLGRFVRKKGFDVLLEAFSRLPEQVAGRPLYLLLLGDGKEFRALRQYAEALGLGGRIRMPGWRTDPLRFFALSDAFVCPSRDEPFGNVLLEAISLGQTVVSTQTVGAEEVLPKGAARVVPIDDASAMANAIEEVLRDDAARREMAVAGRHHYEANFSPEVILAQYEALYAELAERGR